MDDTFIWKDINNMYCVPIKTFKVLENALKNKPEDGHLLYVAKFEVVMGKKDTPYSANSKVC